MLKTPESRVLLLLLIAVCVAWVVMPESGVKRELKQKDKEYSHRIDSIKTLYIGALKRINQLEIQKRQDHLATEQAVEAKKIAEEKAQRALKKYESIRKLNYSNAQLDSMLLVLYPR